MDNQTSNIQATTNRVHEPVEHGELAKIHTLLVDLNNDLGDSADMLEQLNRRLFGAIPSPPDAAATPEPVPNGQFALIQRAFEHLTETKARIARQTQSLHEV